MPLQAFSFKTAGTAIALTGILFVFPSPIYRSTAANVPPSLQMAAKPNGTIVDIAASNPSFSTLVKALKAAGLVETLSGQTQLTVFAPTNKAFAALPKGTLEKLLRPENRETLRQVLTYHVVPGVVESKDIRPGKANTVEGRPVNLRVGHGRIRVNDARVTSADIRASNGIIHVIDQVLLPPNL